MQQKINKSSFYSYHILLQIIHKMKMFLTVETKISVLLFLSLLLLFMVTIIRTIDKNNQDDVVGHRRYSESSSSSSSYLLLIGTYFLLNKNNAWILTETTICTMVMIVMQVHYVSVLECLYPIGHQIGVVIESEFVVPAVPEQFDSMTQQYLFVLV